MPKQQPIRGRGFGGRKLTKAQWRQTKKQMKRESAKGYKTTLNDAQRFQTKYPTPKSKPQPVQMQRAANERIETLRNENHRLTSRVTQLTRQLEEVSRIAQVQRLLQPGI
jgi:hypothetical protein